jgi:hypothetical protein
MTWTYDQILQDQAEQIQAGYAMQNAELEAGRHEEDAYRVREASNAILELDRKRDALAARAQQYYGQQRAQQQPTNRFHLSETEREVAEASIVDRPDMPKLTADQKHEIYARNRDRLSRMKMSGEYSTTKAWPRGPTDAELWDAPDSRDHLDRR